MKRFVTPFPGSRSRRFAHHDYRGGAYFVTTNTKNRAPLFGTVEQGRMYLNRYGKIVAKEWKRTDELRDEVSLDTFIVMPDHLHGLLWICSSDTESKREANREIRKTLGEDDREARQSQEGNSERTYSDEKKLGKEESRDASRDSSDLPPGLQKRRAGTLSTIIGCFKAAATRRIHRLSDWEHVEVWQSSFHDHIVRNRDELRRIRHYIRTNPQRQH